MYLFKKQGMLWPPAGWKHFSSVKKSRGQALSKDPATATITGLSYNVESSPVYLDDSDLTQLYAFRIDGWSYSIHNESYEYPILSFHLLDRPATATRKAPFMSNLKVNARNSSVTEGMAHRVIMAALFFMKQIDGQNVPDHEQILKLYRLEAMSNASMIMNCVAAEKQRPLQMERPERRFYKYLLRSKGD